MLRSKPDLRFKIVVIYFIRNRLKKGVRDEICLYIQGFRENYYPFASRRIVYYREFSQGSCMDDRTAISRLKQGDLNALETLVNRYQVRAVQAAYLVVYDRALAEDIAQTAFVKAAERIDQFDEQRPFPPWFFRIVMNDAIKAARRLRQNVSLDDRTAALAAWLTDPAPSPAQLLEEKELRQSILNAIKSLTPEQRAVVVMRYFLEMSEAEMSAKMERPLSTIKWWLREARRHLSDLVGPKTEGE